VFHDRVTGLAWLEGDGRLGVNDIRATKPPALPGQQPRRRGDTWLLLGASIVPRQSRAPQRHANCFFSFRV
jgi:hypothetical protein